MPRGLDCLEPALRVECSGIGDELELTLGGGRHDLCTAQPMEAVRRKVKGIHAVATARLGRIAEREMVLVRPGRRVNDPLARARVLCIGSKREKSRERDA